MLKSGHFIRYDLRFVSNGLLGEYSHDGHPAKSFHGKPSMKRERHAVCAVTISRKRKRLTVDEN